VADPASIDALCAKIVSGETLTSIARNLGAGLSTLTDWIAANPERSARAREARVASAASYDDQALEAIRDAKDPFELSKAKEEAHHLRWRAAKANPKAYGDKLALAGDDESPLTVVVRKLSD
jgi:hypothetical protein